MTTSINLRTLVHIIALLLLFSCKRKECNGPITELRLINKTVYPVGRNEIIKITNQDKIHFIDSLIRDIKKTKNVIHPIVNNNNGYIDALFSTNSCKCEGYFNIVYIPSPKTVLAIKSDHNTGLDYYEINEFAKYIESLFKMEKNELK